MKILFVDDNPRVQEYLLSTFSASDHEFFVCNSIHEAINLLSSKKDVEAIITSIVISGSSNPNYRPQVDIYRNAIDLAQWVKEDRPLVPVIGYSHHAMPREYEEGLGLVFDAFLWSSDFESGLRMFETAVESSIIARIATSEGLPNDYVTEIVQTGDFRLISEERRNIILPGTREYRSWVEVSNRINDEFLKRLAKDSNALSQMDDRLFEELCATLLMRDGHLVHMTSKSDDGGFDLLAFKSDRYRTGFFLVECKRYDSSLPNNNVGVPVLRALNGVVHSMNASGGMIMTTSSFTKRANEYAQQESVGMDLVDFIKLRSWMDDVAG